MSGASIDWPGFIAATALIELTPGPNMAWLAGLSLSEGRRAGLAATAGIAIGLFINALVAATGLAELIATYPGGLVWLRRCGAVLMLLLAWQAWHGSDADPRQSAEHRGFGAGLLLNLLNPKAFVFFLVVVPPFLSGGALQLRQALLLGIVSVTIATAAHLAVVFGAAQASGWATNPARARLVRRAMAMLMVGVAVWFLAG